MKIDILTERIKKAEAKIEKKNGTISKKSALIEKKYKEAETKYGVVNPKEHKSAEYARTNHNDLYWLYCDISNLEDDLIRLEHEIQETETTLEKYKAQLAGELEKESIFLKEIPAAIKKP